MALPLSKSQIDKLGKRLAASDPPADEDLALLEEVLGAYDTALTGALGVLTELGFEPTGRLKTTGTLVDKLRRQSSMSLKNMQDIAGARVVVSGGRRQQDEDVRRIVERFTSLEGCREPIDRRSNPSSGYRAVHIVVTVGDLPVEIQVRTELQDLWAQAFERLADRWGRGIRYGEDPIDPDAPAFPGASTSAVPRAWETRRDICDALRGDISDIIAREEALVVATEDLEAEVARQVGEPEEELVQAIEEIHRLKDDAEKALRATLGSWRKALEEDR